MRIRHSATLLAIWALCGGVRAEDSDSLARRIDEYIQRFAKQRDFSGTVLIGRDGKVVFKKAYGDANLELNVPNAVNTRFLIASVAAV